MRAIFPFYNQLDSMDCGPTCLRMVAKFYGKTYSLPFLREKCYIDKAGVSLKGISEAAELIGLRTFAANIPLVSDDSLSSLFQAPLPAIVHWNQNHYVVVYKIGKTKIWIADPASGKHVLTYTEFNQSFAQKDGSGIALLLEPAPHFYTVEAYDN